MNSVAHLRLKAVADDSATCLVVTSITQGWSSLDLAYPCTSYGYAARPRYAPPARTVPGRPEPAASSSQYSARPCCGEAFHLIGPGDRLLRYALVFDVLQDPLVVVHLWRVTGQGEQL